METLSQPTMKETHASKSTTTSTTIPVILISAPSSDVGKTTITTGIMAALAQRGLIVQPFKCGPDFLDGMHHESAIRAGRNEYERKCQKKCQKNKNPENRENEESERRKNSASGRVRKCVNLDGWMMNQPHAHAHAHARASPKKTSSSSSSSRNAIISCYNHHSRGADIAIIEGCMGLHDSKNGISDSGSTAQIAKYLSAPVILTIDGKSMARSVAAMVLGYKLFDLGVNLGGVVVNKVGGSVHRQWIEDAIGGDERLDGVLFAGCVPLDECAIVKERYLGLTMPHEHEIEHEHENENENENDTNENSTVESKEVEERYVRLAALMEHHLALDDIVRLAQTSVRPLPSMEATSIGTAIAIDTFTFHPMLQSVPTNTSTSTNTDTDTDTSTPRCRIAIAQDAAFCFYYQDNLSMLRSSGAELIPFSPLNSNRLPENIDGIYMGGGYPELPHHAKRLEENESLREDIRSYSDAGGVIYAECGGFMYLADQILVRNDQWEKSGDGDGDGDEGGYTARNMCGVFPITVRMTPHVKMYYAEMEFTSRNPIFPIGGRVRGQKYHYSEVMDEDENTSDASRNIHVPLPLSVTPQLPGAEPEGAGYAVKNTMASYFHIYFASFAHANANANTNPPFRHDGDGIQSADGAVQALPIPKTHTLADHFLENAIAQSPCRKAYAVSFASTATEIIYALNAQSALAGVTSVCDYPSEARCSPRRVVCRSPMDMDAGSMSSEEVSRIMEQLKLQREQAATDIDKGGPPGHWVVDSEALKSIRPRVAFVQNTCDICDAATDDVMHALKDCGLESDNCTTVKVNPTTLEGLFDSIEVIANVLDARDHGEDLVSNLRGRLDQIDMELAKIEKSPRPRVLSLEGLSPLCIGGNWLPDVKWASGCVDALGDVGGCPSRIISWEEIEDADPDILMISPCSASPTRTLNEIHLLASSAKFWSLRCVQKGDVYIMDHGLFSRPGPRLVEGIEMMAILFRCISLPSLSPVCRTKWAKDALKYQCCVTNDGGAANSTSVSHCTTELAARFVPCFEDLGTNCFTNISGRTPIKPKREMGLTLCQATRCTIPGFPLPPNRSAHCIVPIKRTGNKDMTLLLLAGESTSAERLTDVWELHAPSNGWSAASSLDGKRAQHSFPKIGTTGTWEYLICGKVAGENVPTPRSNHASVACGEHILTFGGWGADNVTPLSHCELLHADTLCWTHCSTRGSLVPNPRGNPTLAFQRESNCVILFGGWNGEHALKDLWCLDMNVWQWHNITDKKNDVNDSWPRSRTDHSAVMWETEEDYDIMLVFGGNIEGIGPCSELWALEVPKESENRQNAFAFNWNQLLVSGSGPTPPARTSHSAAIVGKRNSQKMVIVGGTDSSRGASRGSMLCDAWILDLNGAQQHDPIWIKLDWSGSGLNRCRHAMAAVDSSTVVWWGGYDGDVTVDDNVGVWRGCIDSTCDGTSLTRSIADEVPMKPTIALRERWEAEIPVRVEDLPADTLAKAKRSRLPGAMYKAIHRHAVANNRDTYIDPASGYSVFSQVYLKRRPCCGNGCRHCPHGYVNVPGKNNTACGESEMGAGLDW